MPGQIHQMQTKLLTQLIANATPDAAVHRPAVPVRRPAPPARRRNHRHSVSPAHPSPRPATPWRPPAPAPLQSALRRRRPPPARTDRSPRIALWQWRCCCGSPSPVWRSAAAGQVWPAGPGFFTAGRSHIGTRFSTFVSLLATAAAVSACIALYICKPIDTVLQTERYKFG